MTVKELKEEIRNYPDNMEVVIQGKEHYGCNPLDLVCKLEIEPSANDSVDEYRRKGFPRNETHMDNIFVFFTTRRI